MKKFKKMLAGLLGAAMVLTSFGTPTWADTSDLKKTPATFDDSYDGQASLTIHKYEYNDDSKGDPTGENDTPPEGATPLKGAEFTVYKVEDAAYLSSYYTEDEKKRPTVDDYLTNDTSDTNKKVINSKKVLKTIGPEKTNADGIAKFENLNFGLYVVMETKHPDSVTVPEDPFLVSIPMTTVDGSNWLYDVNVFPKNKTSYGNIELLKVGKNGTPLSGVAFKLEKYVNSTWSDVTTLEEYTDKNIKFNLKTDEDGKISVSGLTNGTYRFVESNRGNDNVGYIMNGKAEYKFKIENGVAIGIDSTTIEGGKIKVINEKPDLTKEVKDRTTGGWKHDSDYNVGDFVPYKITINVPSNITELKKFTVTDTPVNLEDIIKNQEDGTSAVTLTCDGKTVSGEAYTIEGGTRDNVHGFVINFIPTKMREYAGKDIIVNYKAKLLADAETTTKGNPNTATLEYSNKILPDTDSDVDNPSTDKIEDKTVVYTFNLQIHKTSSDNKDLLGVTFDLYKEVETTVDGKPTVDGARKGSEFANTGLAPEKYWINVEKNLTTVEGGLINYSGLSNGNYCLVETHTQKGYNLLKAPISVKLNIKYTTKFKQETKTEGGVATIVKNEIKTQTYDKNDSTGVFENGTVTETVINRKGFELPRTGDIGTAMFLIIGIGGMLAAVYIMLRGRKRA